MAVEVTLNLELVPRWWWRWLPPLRLAWWVAVVGVHLLRVEERAMGVLVRARWWLKGPRA